MGLITGVIIEYQCEKDMNSISLKRQWTAHAGAITGLIYSALILQIFSCGKDRNLVWHCSDNANKIGKKLLLYKDFKFFCPDLLNNFFNITLICIYQFYTSEKHFY